MINHASNNKEDRKLGEKWERNFCLLAWEMGKVFTPLQIGKRESANAWYRKNRDWKSLTLPDITVWTYPGEHHEIKHKAPTRYNTFGLEEYRLKALLCFARETRQDVMYTIHNHALSGGRDSSVNRLEDWYTVNVCQLEGTTQYQGFGGSYVNGRMKNVMIFYWNINSWMPLVKYWEIF